MITNERQYKITKAALDKLDESIKGFDFQRGEKAAPSKTLAKAHVDALASERQVLADQLREYEVLKSGAIADFTAESLRELPALLVKARIAKGMSQRQLAERLGLKEQQIQRYEAEKYASASLRRINEVADALNLRVTKHARLHPETSKTASTQTKLDWDGFPLTEMYRRGWFTDFVGSLAEVKMNADSLLAHYLTIAGVRSSSAFHHKHVRSGGVLNRYALLAWECRILWLAQKEAPAVSFAVATLTDEWLSELVRLSARPNSPVLAKEYLRNSGITLVVEPHLPQTYLDGAALRLSNEKPVIGMTLRYDRLDNFWFVLLHELAHLRLHFRKAEFREFFDDLDAGPDEVEAEADAFARDALLPNPIWETAVARYLRTSDSVKSLANQIGVSPAIIAGRIQREADNYILLKELIGVGQVRRQFPDVKYGQ